MKQTVKYTFIALIISMLSAASASGIDNKYVMEIGAQVGANYYIGDANPHIFMHPRELAGAQLRYKFDRRWCLSGKLNWSRFGYEYGSYNTTKPGGTNTGGTTPGTDPGTNPGTDPGTGGGGTGGGGTFPGGGGTLPGGGGTLPGGRGMPQRSLEKPWGDNDGLSVRPLISGDVVAEFNFFEYGNDWEMGRIKPYTPYIFLGVGLGWYGIDWSRDSKLGFPISLYVPFGVGFKWKFAPRWGLNIAWQHNLYFKDNLEAKADLNNTNELNGSNILENDLTGQLMVGIVFDFAKAKKACKTCTFY